MHTLRDDYTTHVRTVQQTQRDVTQFTIKANVTFRARTFRAQRARSTAETRVNLYRLSPLHAFLETRYRIGLSPPTKRTIDVTSYKTLCLTFWNTDSDHVAAQTRYTNRFSQRRGIGIDLVSNVLFRPTISGSADSITILVSHPVVPIQASFVPRKSKNMNSVASLFRELFIELNVVVLHQWRNITI